MEVVLLVLHAVLELLLEGSPLLLHPLDVPLRRRDVRLKDIHRPFDLRLRAQPVDAEIVIAPLLQKSLSPHYSYRSIVTKIVITPLA